MPNEVSDNQVRCEDDEVHRESHFHEIGEAVAVPSAEWVCRTYCRWHEPLSSSPPHMHPAHICFLYLLRH